MNAETKASAPVQPARSVVRSQLATETHDGWRLSLFHYRSEIRRQPRQYPVLLVHGLASNHHTYDLDRSVSLARHLAGRGYLVYALDLRGRGDSQPLPSCRSPRSWAFDDYLNGDLPAAIDRVRAHAGDAAQVHMVGHSMGGLLLFAHLSEGAADIRAGIAIASSLDYSSGSGFGVMQSLLPVSSLVPFVPIQSVARGTHHLFRAFPSPFDKFNIWATNVDKELWRRACRTVFQNVSTPVMRQLSSALQPGGLKSRDGTIRYADGLERVTTPILSIIGDRDVQCTPEAARSTYDALVNAPRRLLELGPSHGCVDHYGHFDPIIGVRAPNEVYPHIDAFLDANDC